MFYSLLPHGLYLPGSSVHGILQARILEWVAMPISRGPSQPKNWTWISHIAGRFFTVYSALKSPAWQADSLLLSYQGSPLMPGHGHPNSTQLSVSWFWKKDYCFRMHFLFTAHSLIPWSIITQRWTALLIFIEGWGNWRKLHIKQEKITLSI